MGEETEVVGAERYTKERICEVCMTKTTVTVDSAVTTCPCGGKLTKLNDYDAFLNPDGEFVGFTYQDVWADVHRREKAAVRQMFREAGIVMDSCTRYIAA